METRYRVRVVQGKGPSASMVIILVIFTHSTRCHAALLELTRCSIPCCANCDKPVFTSLYLHPCRTRLPVIAAPPSPQPYLLFTNTPLTTRLTQLPVTIGILYTFTYPQLTNCFQRAFAACLSYISAIALFPSAIVLRKTPYPDKHSLPLPPTTGLP